MIRVYPPERPWKRGPTSWNSLWSTSRFPSPLSDDPGCEGRDTSAVTTARQLGAGIGAALAGFVLLETVPHSVLRAAEHGVAPLPKLHDAAGLAFGLLGLIVLLSLPATRGIRVTPRRSRPVE